MILSQRISVFPMCFQKVTVLPNCTFSKYSENPVYSGYINMRSITLVRMNEILKMMQKLTSETSQTLKLKVNRTVQMEDGTRKKEIMDKQIYIYGYPGVRNIHKGNKTKPNHNIYYNNFFPVFLKKVETIVQVPFCVPFIYFFKIIPTTVRTSDIILNVFFLVFRHN